MVIDGDGLIVMGRPNGGPPQRMHPTSAGAARPDKTTDSSVDLRRVAYRERLTLPSDIGLQSCQRLC